MTAAVELDRAPRAPSAPRITGPYVSPWLRRVLGVSLPLKLAGASALAVVAATAGALAAHAAGADGPHMAALLLGVMVVALAVNTGLVLLALRPLRALEQTARRVWQGDLRSRVEPSLIADRDMARTGNIVNLLLDSLEGERTRMRRLASQVIAAQDTERSRIARELHDSTAQTLAAIVLQVSAAVRDCDDPALSARLESVYQMASEALEEVRTLSHTVYPRVLDDLGLTAALEWLARRTRDQRGVAVEVASASATGDLPPEVAAALYRVAQEGIQNAARHGSPRRITVRLAVTSQAVTLEVTDDGIGFDVAEARERRPGMGLFAMEERVALVHGRLDIRSAAGRGTRVVATIPLDGRVSNAG